MDECLLIVLKMNSIDIFIMKSVWKTEIRVVKIGM